MNCRICKTPSQVIFEATVLHTHQVQYYHCYQCGFLSTETPYWLEDAYKNPINLSDTGYIQRNIGLAAILTPILRLFFKRKGRYLDYAGGYGVFVRLMRDYGFDFYWEDKYTENIFAKGFEWTPDTGSIEAITSFEVFEHLPDPIAEIEKLFAISPTLFFSTELLPDPIPAPDDWWYYGLNHGQHISFYSEKTLRYIAQKYGLTYLHYNHQLHILTQTPQISQFKLTMLGHYHRGCRILKRGWHRLEQRWPPAAPASKTWDDHLRIAKR